MITRLLRIALILAAAFQALRADDGYQLWLKYHPLSDAAQRSVLSQHLDTVHVTGSSPTAAAIREEIVQGLNGLLQSQTRVGDAKSASLLIGTPAGSAGIAEANLESKLRALGSEGYVIQSMNTDGRQRVVIAANSEVGALYGTFAFLRILQQPRVDLGTLNISESPKMQVRLLNHWDNLNRFVERGQAGFSLWDWFNLPDYLSPRYKDYARANASIGINGTVLTNVNADATVLTDEYLEKVAALANVFRPYGIKVYLTARFSAPREIGNLDTADPLDPRVAAWWKDCADRIYRKIPDFGGFLVKANSEGQPGPQDYQRNHADGANMLADAVAPHGGIVMWRAFVYDHNVPADRAKQAYTEFQPLDGQFRDNVVIQIKNGPIDFMPREPFHPLFGAMPKTSLGLELQITQEYLGGAIHLAYLAPLFEETLDADTFAEGPSSTVARVIDGSLSNRKLSVIAGVANIGNDRNWTGHPLAQANWYAFGRLAWNHQLSSREIANEWVRQSLISGGAAEKSISDILMESREAVVDYSMPLGLHHIMAMGHHYGPGPWVDRGRPDWTSVYYHRADQQGIGFNRTVSGSNALEQYAPALQEQWGNLQSCPDNLLLWFHHVAWDHQMKSGRTLWDELGFYYQRGVDSVRSWQKRWGALKSEIDPETHHHVEVLLERQEREAREYKDACLLYFQTFSGKPFPAGVEPAEYSLDHYKSIRRVWVPGNPSGR